MGSASGGLMAWCDRRAVRYILGLAKNERINDLAAPPIEKARRRCEVTGRKQGLDPPPDLKNGKSALEPEKGLHGGILQHR